MIQDINKKKIKVMATEIHPLCQLEIDVSNMIPFVEAHGHSGMCTWIAKSFTHTIVS
jgi:hypothetical protein